MNARPLDMTDSDKLALAAAAAANGGLLPDHLRGKAAGLELRGGEVHDLDAAAAEAEALTDPQEVFGRVIGGTLYLFNRKLTSADKSAFDGLDQDAHGAFEGYIGAVDGFQGSVAQAAPFGGADGFHPDATVADVIQPSEGLVQTPADSAKSTPAGDAKTASEKNAATAATSASIKGADKPAK